MQQAPTLAEGTGHEELLPLLRTCLPVTVRMGEEGEDEECVGPLPSSHPVTVTALPISNLGRVPIPPCVRDEDRGLSEGRHLVQGHTASEGRSPHSGPGSGALLALGSGCHKGEITSCFGLRALDLNLWFSQCANLTRDWAKSVFPGPCTPAQPPVCLQALQVSPALKGHPHQ